MLSWEFPPKIIGGISAHVYELSKALVKNGVRVYVITCDYPDAPEYEEVDGVQVYRVDSYKIPTPDSITWALMMNTNLQIKAAQILSSAWDKINIVHAHDWLVAPACVGLKHLYRLPLVSTIHSTEHGRRGGIHSDYNRMIASIEAWLVRESWRTICCSQYMALEVSTALSIAIDNLDVIPNGIDTKIFEVPYDLNSFRERFVSPEEKLVLYVGRLVQEKGVNLLIEAIPYVLHKVNARFVIVGDGYLKEELLRKAIAMGFSQKVSVCGFLDTNSVRLLFRAADVCVVPSLYEPFGIAALEAMAAKTPLVTTGFGGLGEIVKNDITGIIVQPTPTSIAWGIVKALADLDYSNKLRLMAYDKVRSVYRWDAIAQNTYSVYKRVLQEYERHDWKPSLKR